MAGALQRERRVASDPAAAADDAYFHASPLMRLAFGSRLNGCCHDLIRDRLHQLLDVRLVEILRGQGRDGFFHGRRLLAARWGLSRRRRTCVLWSPPHCRRAKESPRHSSGPRFCRPASTGRRSSRISPSAPAVPSSHRSKAFGHIRAAWPAAGFANRHRRSPACSTHPPNPCRRRPCRDC